MQSPRRSGSFREMSTVVTVMRRRWEGRGKVTMGGSFCGIRLRRMIMKAAFGILALYVSIPLAIVAAQNIVAHETALQQNAAHAVVAQVAPVASVTAR
jgi:hypothetical protein